MKLKQVIKKVGSDETGFLLDDFCCSVIPSPPDVVVMDGGVALGLRNELSH